MVWKVPRIWEEGDVWILGGGPSITKQFNIPDNIVRQVLDKKLPLSAYSSYLSPLHDKHVIGINVAYMIGSWVDMVFFGDPRFFKVHMHGLVNFPGLKVSCAPGSEKVPWVKYLSRDGGRKTGISPDPSKVSWNFNSGAAAISLAANAGAKRIILLGFDMTLNEAGQQHWHNAYGNNDMSPQIKRQRVNSLPFNKHLSGFPAIASDAKKRGIEILNACPTSAIEAFPKFTVKQLLYDNT